MPTPVNAIIVEDEVRGLINLKALLSEHCPHVTVVGEAGTLEDARELIAAKRGETQLAFLDINLPDGQIFSLLDECKPLGFNAIFVTAFDQFAIKAFEYASIGYILKPIDPFALSAAVERLPAVRPDRLDEQLAVLQDGVAEAKFDRITISAVDGLYFVPVKDILRIEADDNYSHIFTQGGQRHTVSKTIKFYEDMLTQENFFRVHKSHIINMDYMTKFVKGEGGHVVMNDGKELVVSRRRRTPFMDRMRAVGSRVAG